MYCLPKDYIERETTEPCGRDENSLDWQWHVYERVAHRYPDSRVLDLGCGDGTKTVRFFKDSVGVEFGENYRRCKSLYPKRDWIEWDLSKPPYPDFGEYDVVLCADVIEHLPDPRVLLGWIFHGFTTDDDLVVVLTTPEREIVHGIEHRGPPTNRHHYREWALGEFSEMISRELPYHKRKTELVRKRKTELVRGHRKSPIPSVIMVTL